MEFKPCTTRDAADYSVPLRGIVLPKGVVGKRQSGDRPPQQGGRRCRAVKKCLGEGIFWWVGARGCATQFNSTVSGDKINVEVIRTRRFMAVHVREAGVWLGVASGDRRRDSAHSLQGWAWTEARRQVCADQRPVWRAGRVGTERLLNLRYGKEVLAPGGQIAEQTRFAVTEAACCSRPCHSCLPSL